MNPAEVLRDAPSLEILESTMSMRTLQLALLQQQYAPNHALFSKSSLNTTPIAELAELNMGGSDFGSDKVTVGDATSVYVWGDLALTTVDPRWTISSAISSANVTRIVTKPFYKGQRTPSSPNRS